MRESGPGPEHLPLFCGGVLRISQAGPASSGRSSGCLLGSGSAAPAMAVAAHSAGEPAVTGLSAPLAVLTSSGDVEPTNSAKERRRRLVPAAPTTG